MSEGAEGSAVASEVASIDSGTVQESTVSTPPVGGALKEPDGLMDVDLESPGPSPARTAEKSEKTLVKVSSGLANDLGLALNDPQLQTRDVTPVSTRLAGWKSWGVMQIKYARQTFSEKFGRGSRTVDKQLDEQVEDLREAQRKYEQILQHVKKLSAQIRAVLETQRSMADLLSDYSVRTQPLEEAMKRNALTQRQAVRNGEMLVAVLDFFYANIQTLLTKTMGDTFAKVKEYEATRVCYDAFRSDLESLQALLETNPASVTAAKKAKLEAASQAFETNRAHYDSLRNDVAVKLKFLDENRVKVVRQQLVLMQNATTAYFTGDTVLLEQCIKQFHVKVQPSTVAATAASDTRLAFQPLPLEANFSVLESTSKSSIKDGVEEDKEA